MPTSDLRRAYVDLLMEQVRSNRFPSPSMLDRIEASVSDRESADEYVRALVESLSQGRYPSPTMLDRVEGLLAQLDRAG